MHNHSYIPALIITFALFAIIFSVAAQNVLAQSSDFVPIQTLPGYLVPGQTASDVPDLLNSTYRIGVGLGAILAVFMIIWGGFQYMTSNIPGVKSDGKRRIWNALFGLALILLSALIISLINPDILNFDIFRSAPPAWQSFIT